MAQDPVDISVNPLNNQHELVVKQELSSEENQEFGSFEEYFGTKSKEEKFDEESSALNSLIKDEAELDEFEDENMYIYKVSVEDIKSEIAESEKNVGSSSSDSEEDEKMWESMTQPKEEEIAVEAGSSSIKQEEVIIKDEAEPDGKSPNLTVHKCDQCGYQAFCESDLAKHLIIHTNPIKVENEPNLTSLPHEESSKANMHGSDQCDYQTAFESYLKKPEEAILPKCDQCNFQTTKKSYLTRHKNLHGKHGAFVTLKCHECDYQTLNKVSLKKHIIRHRNYDDLKKVKCDECPYQTIRNGDLKRHSARSAHKKYQNLS